MGYAMLRFEAEMNGPDVMPGKVWPSSETAADEYISFLMIDNEHDCYNCFDYRVRLSQLLRVPIWETFRPIRWEPNAWTRAFLAISFMEPATIDPSCAQELVRAKTWSIALESSALNSLTKLGYYLAINDVNMDSWTTVWTTGVVSKR